MRPRRRIVGIRRAMALPVDPASFAPYPRAAPVSWQSVARKPQPSVHALGAEAAAAAEAPVEATSAAAATPQELSDCDDCRSKKCRALHCEPPWLEHARFEAGTRLVGKKVPTSFVLDARNSDPSGSCATVILRGQRVRRRQLRWALAKFSESEASDHTPSLADFTTTTPELKFSVHITSFLFGNLYSRCEAAFWLALTDYRNSTKWSPKATEGVTSMSGMP